MGAAALSPVAAHPAAVSTEQRQAFRAVNATGHEADCVGRKGGDGLLAHAYCVVPMALLVNHQIGASAPDPRRPVAGRTDGRVGPSFLGTSSFDCAAGVSASAAAFSEGR